jgi:acyl carrier protein
MDYFKTLRNFVAAKFLEEDSASLRDDPLLPEAFLADPRQLRKLVGFLERTYGIKIEPEEMLPENLASVDRITAFVAQKTVILGSRPQSSRPDLVAA